MAPKWKASTRGAPSSSGRRTTRKPAPVAPPSPSTSSSSSSWPDAPAPSPNPLTGRVVTTGRKVSFEFLEQEGFQIRFLIQEQGWGKLCSLNLPTYPALVHEFYSSAARGDGGLVGTVRGKTVRVNQSVLSELLDLPTVGMAPQSHSDRAGALSRLIGREVNELEEISANQLSVELRLLHNICGRILFPKIGRFDFISERDIVLLDCIMSSHPLNLPCMMISYMAEACSKKKASLPYGMVLTLVFRSQGVQIPKNEPKKILRHTDFYDASTLHRMGYKKVNNIWEKKHTEEQHVHNREAPPVHFEDISEPAPSAPPAAPAEAAATTSEIPSVPTALLDDQMNRLMEFIRNEQEETRRMISQQQEKF